MNMGPSIKSAFEYQRESGANLSGDAADARRYRFLRDSDWDEIPTVIAWQGGVGAERWDKMIDEAIEDLETQT